MYAVESRTAKEANCDKPRNQESMRDVVNNAELRAQSTGRRA